MSVQVPGSWDVYERLTCTIKPGSYNQIIDRVCVNNVSKAGRIEIARLGIDGDFL